ncbi:MAG: hypothetical protein R3E42_10790 [Burkholderiaceae bacterium]
MWAVRGAARPRQPIPEDRPTELQAEFDALVARIMKLAGNPVPDTSTDYATSVLDARAHGAELCLWRSQLRPHARGARGHLALRGATPRARSTVRGHRHTPRSNTCARR